MKSADYVIIGSGSAGAAMAYRLSEDGKNTVIVLEFGGSDIGPFVQMPAALAYPMNMDRYNWGYMTEPEPHLNNRRMIAPRGKVIGGSSSINGMVYVRGHAEDFNRWEEMGATGWGYADVLPYFKRQETSHGGEEGWRGTNGPLHVRRGEVKNPLYRAFIEAGRQAGFPVTEDYNGRQQEGFGLMEQTSWQGRRWSTANAYLKPALKRPNVSLIRCYARKVVMEGTRAVGVEVEIGGKIEVVKANREVIVAASAFNSPKILMLSGIGPAAHLKEMGIPVVADRPGVGQNLQDHLELYLQYACKQPVSIYPATKWWNQPAIGAQWLFLGKGLGASNQFEAGGFIRTREEFEWPNIQYHFLPVAINYNGSNGVKEHGFQAHMGSMRSPSRGRIQLKSKNPRDYPSILFNYMATEQDWQEFRDGIRLTREIMQQPALDPYRGREISPGIEVQTDEQLDKFIREHAETAFHPSCSCKMGTDEMAVVDNRLRVHGLANIRVADASIMPSVVNGNTNATCIMIGEKAADMIRHDNMSSKNSIAEY